MPPDDDYCTFLDSVLLHAVAGNHLVYLHVLRSVAVNRRDQHGWTVRPLDRADPDGWTPIMIAARQGHVDIVRYLHDECQCQLDRKDNRGKTILAVLLENEEYSTICRLLEGGLNSQWMVEFLTEKSEDSPLIPPALRRYAKNFSPRDETVRDQLERVLAAGDVDALCMILTTDSTKILDLPQAAIQNIMKLFKYENFSFHCVMSKTERQHITHKTDWLIDWLTVFRALIDRVINWLIDWLIDCPSDWLIVRVVDWLIVRVVDWLIDCSIRNEKVLWTDFFSF